MSLFLSASNVFNDFEDEANCDVQESYSTESLPAALSSKMQVFLRIRPASPENEKHNHVYSVKNSSVLIVKNSSPVDTSRRSKFSKFNENSCRKKFKFSKIFNPSADQSEFFNESVRPIIIDFLNNQSSTVVTYGTTNAGKTYTAFGLTSEPGIVPRSIEFIYSSLNCTLTPWYKPKRFSSVVNLEERDRSLEVDVREKLLSSRQINKSACEEAYRDLENSEQQKKRDIFKDSMYSIWISFVEIYNESIFDLLQVDEEGKNVQLKLATDKNGSTYIQGMQSLCATTGLEAYEIFQAGLSKLSTASALNYKSSRSHSIFTIKLIKYEPDSTLSDVKVTSISFCDLAGTGRMQKSISNNNEFKESRSINTSLLTFGRCLKLLAEGHFRQSIGPFRESKLTRLFQPSFYGNENIIVIINMNPTFELFAETQRVLNFAWIAMRLTLDLTKEERKPCEFYTPVSTPKTSSKVPRERRSRLPTLIHRLHVERYQDLNSKNQELEAELKELKSIMLKNEYQVCDELSNTYAKQLKDLEETWNNRMLMMKEKNKSMIKFSADCIETYYKEKLEETTNCECKRSDAGDCAEQIEVKVIEEESPYFSSKILSRRKSLETIKIENEELKVQNNQQVSQIYFLNECLKKVVEFINSADKRLENLTDYSSLNVNDTCNIPDNEKIVFYMSVIQEFIKNSFEYKSGVEKVFKILDSKAVQCNLINSTINECFQEIQELVEPAEIDCCIDLTQDNQEDGLLMILPKMKNWITRIVSKMTKLELENIEKLSEINDLNKKVEQQERDLLQLKIQRQESECTPYSLNKKLDKLSTTNCSLDSGLRSSFVELDAEKNEINTSMSSSASVDKNDSGLAFSIDCITDEKCCQTYSLLKEERLFQEKLHKLKLDYKQMKIQHLEESLKVTKLSQELEFIKETMSKLKSSINTKNRIIFELKKNSEISEIEIQRLSNENHMLDLQRKDLEKELKEIDKDYDLKLNDLKVQLRVHREGETKATKCLQSFWEKKLNKLENELNVKRANESELTEKIVEYKRNLAKLDRLSEKIHDFEQLVDGIEREKMDLRMLLNERLESQLKMKEKVQNLIIKVEKREGEILSLKSELNSVIMTNLSNSRKSKDLCRDLRRLSEKLGTLKDDVGQSEVARKNLELVSIQEIDTLRSRLSIFEENDKFFNFINDMNEDKQREVDSLKVKLSEKDRELEFFKKNRNATIQRYECLVHQLQDALKINYHSRKFKKLFPQKQKYFFNGFKEGSVRNVNSSEPQIRHWKSFKNEACLSYSSGTTALTTSCESSESMISYYKDEPSRLVIENTEKYSQMDSETCKDLYMSNNIVEHQSLKLDSLQSDRILVRTECQTKFQLH